MAPPSAEHLQQAVAIIDRALAVDKAVFAWIYPDFLFAKALAEYRSGRYESAITICEGEAAEILGPAPEFVAAMAQHRLGNEYAARQALAKANGEFDGGGDAVRNPKEWLYFILRREAHEQIDPLDK